MAGAVSCHGPRHSARLRPRRQRLSESATDGGPVQLARPAVAEAALRASESLMKTTTTTSSNYPRRLVARRLGYVHLLGSVLCKTDAIVPRVVPLIGAGGKDNPTEYVVSGVSLGFVRVGAVVLDDPAPLERLPKGVPRTRVLASSYAKRTSLGDTDTIV